MSRFLPVAVSPNGRTVVANGQRPVVIIGRFDPANYRQLFFQTCRFPEGRALSTVVKKRLSGPAVSHYSVARSRRPKVFSYTPSPVRVRYISFCTYLSVNAYEPGGYRCTTRCSNCEGGGRLHGNKRKIKSNERPSSINTSIGVPHCRTTS